MQLKPRKRKVDVGAGATRPSRIRRDPPVRVVERPVTAYPSERESLIVIVGVILFAVAISIITFGISQITSN